MLTSRLERPKLKSQTQIIPWDGRCHKIISPEQVPLVESGAGTDPSVVLEDPASRKILQEANLWFLMTDGYIKNQDIHKFANAISDAGVHGTASVIILFGYRVRSPFECNVSVGMSVFAVAPDCIFLFHDVKSSDVYVLQAKGSFAGLLPEDAKFTSFGPSTRWSDLTKINYDDPCRVKVTSRTHLSPETVILPGGKVFDMTSIYNDSLSKEETIEILADYCALDVILLAAKTRGKDYAVKSWVDSARMRYKKPEMALMKREDAQHMAYDAMNRLLHEIMARLPPNHEPEDLWSFISRTNIPESTASSTLTTFNTTSLRQSLRYAHERNWAHFTAKADADSELSCNISKTLEEILTTMSVDEHGALATPAMLTPMSSLAQSHELHGVGYELQMSEPRTSPLNALRRRQNSFHPETYPDSLRNGNMTKDLLFLPGYKGERGARRAKRSGAYSTCPICTQPLSIQTILLQASSEEPDTLHLPKTGQQAGHKFPLVLGNYPETDVILPITCCDACASVLLEMGQLPNGQRVTSALPLVSLKYERNRKLWEEKSSEVYDHRFHHSIVLLVFLSTLCTTIEDLIDGAIPPGCQNLRSSLEWCCKEVIKLPGITTVAGILPSKSLLTGAANDAMPLQQAIRVAFSRLQSTTERKALLAYPLDGFLALVRLAGLMKEFGPADIERFIWMRFLYYLSERHVGQQKQASIEKTQDLLKCLIYYMSSSTVIADSSNETV